MRLKGKVSFWFILLTITALASCSQSRVFNESPSVLIGEADNDLNQAEIANKKQMYAFPEMKLAEDQLKEAKELDSLRKEAVLGGITRVNGPVTPDDVSLQAKTSSINSKIVMAKAEREMQVANNTQLGLYLASLQGESNRMHNEAMADQRELQILARADTEKQISQERQAREQAMAQSETTERRDREDASRQAAEAQRQAQMAENFRKQQADLQKNINALSEEVMRVREEKRGLVVSLAGVLFDVDKFALKPGSVQKLNTLANLLKDYPDRRILVEGHADSTGSESYNQQLSERRAEAVRAYLVGNGLASNMVEAKGYGKNLPVATNDTPAGRQQNRRVDIVILNPVPASEKTDTGDKG